MIGKRSRMDCGNHLVSDNIREKNSVKQVSAYGLTGWVFWHFRTGALKVARHPGAQ